MGYYERKVKRLFEGCRKGDRDQIKECLKQSTNFWDENVPAIPINLTNGKKETPLIAAVTGGKRDAVQLVLSHGADVNFRNQAGETALMYAAKLGFVDIAADLIAKGADVNHKNDKGQTVLMYATDAAQSQLTLLLIRKEARVNDCANNGETALMRAACRGDKVSLNALLDKEADIDAVDNRSRTALMHAAINYAPTGVQALLERNANIDKRDNDNKTAFELAAHNDTASIIRAHIKKIATARADKIREAMKNEGLDPEEKEHWLPVGDAAIEHVIASADAPKMLSNAFNFAALQFISVTKNLLTGERSQETTGPLQNFPNQDLVAKAHAQLAALGRKPPPLGRRVSLPEL